ncbi:hypothetical protein PPERSA_06359 [Pseudocohnilembus persalinus]|uniref:RING-type domain-containing protein n=1 Tax=Pseudocohnilembus persalinus TaxID=266149 RepID=A0A0V0QIV8_PSEPJ|nr:hypothetical protein PPERSA_06359 [Pseudocohnilembus persalinus]|eukprot:KRX02164.1 hypothetical protein PPERSA_06359 [Pseudocohnilembus persalinus]
MSEKYNYANLYSINPQTSTYFNINSKYVTFGSSRFNDFTIKDKHISKIHLLEIKQKFHNAYKNLTNFNQRQINSLAFCKNTEENLQCVICLEFFQNCYTLLPCKHSFCEECCSGQLKQNRRCLQCQKLVKKAVQNQYINNLIQLYYQNNISKFNQEDITIPNLDQHKEMENQFKLKDNDTNKQNAQSGFQNQSEFNLEQYFKEQKIENSDLSADESNDESDISSILKQ